MSARRRQTLLHVLVARQGEYEDYRMRIVRAFSDQGRAERYRDELQQQANELCRKWEAFLYKEEDCGKWGRKEARLKRQCKLDPGLELSGGDTQYDLALIPFDGESA